jgi:ABC-type glycerol-3-phosphate transport system permease component
MEKHHLHCAGPQRLAMSIPFLWMVTTALKSQIEVNKGHVGFVPVDDFSFHNDCNALQRP